VKKIYAEFQPLTKLKTPVLFLVFNRPDTTIQVFDIIKKAQPLKLYIAADGPREDVYGEREKTDIVRDIVSKVTWDCDVYTLFRKKNYGCRVAVSNAIDWFFENEEAGIILEDDCLPSLSFFWFCQDMLDKYKNDSRVGQVSGTNILGTFPTDSTYFYSNFGSVWGWATWRRAWELYDVNMKGWKHASEEGYNLKKTIGSFVDFKVRKRNFNMTYNGEIDTWDYQWIFTRLYNRMLVIIPSHNTVTNIGFSDMATHTVSSNSKSNSLKSYNLDLNYRHPKGFIPRYDFEKKVTVHKRGVFGCSPWYCTKRLFNKLFTRRWYG
jgi:hypothetical protein